MGSITFAIAAVAAAASAAADPLMTAMKANGQALCYTRSYDDAWLARHKGQRVREARLALTQGRQGGNLVRIHFAGDFAPYYMYGECSWYEGDLNRGVANDVLDPSFKPTSGVGCHLYTDVTGASAEEGGDFPVEWIEGGRYLQMHLPDSFGAWRSVDVSRNANYQSLGVADRIIRLERAESSACGPLLEQFATATDD